MQEKCAVFRTDELISKGIEEFNHIESSMDNIDVKDKSMIFNTDLTESLELHNLMAQSKVKQYLIQLLNNIKLQLVKLLLLKSMAVQKSL